jgi:glutaminyl-tRNA synthetase
MLEHFQRDDLNRRASRAMAVLHPLKLVIDNYPEGQEEFVEVANNPEDPSAGTRQVPFSREIYIEQDDFREVPPPKYYRLSPGKEVRLRNAYFITAQSVVKDAAGNIVEVHCTYDPASRGGNSPDGRKVKSTMHWVSAAHAISAEIRLYDKLFTKPDPYDLRRRPGRPRQSQPQLARDLTGAKLEPSLANAKLEDRFQFERVGYFCLDPDSTRRNLVFNRTLPLKDSWAKIEKKCEGEYHAQCSLMTARWVLDID